MSWGATPVISEHKADGTPIFVLKFGPGLISYRAIPVLPEGLNRDALRAAMDAQP
jgi:hypothetical protein